MEAATLRSTAQWDRNRSTSGLPISWGVLLGVEQDIAADTVDISLFGTEAVMFDPDFVADLIEEFWRLRRR